MARSALRLTVTGRVQGVGYRWWAVREAQAFGIDGWVRNRADGSVEILAVGPAEAVEAFALVCADGPSAARVAGVGRVPAVDDGSQGFSERATL